MIVLGRPDTSSAQPARSILQSSNFWLLSCFSVLWLSTYWYCHYAYQRDPTSFFFSPAKGYERRYSAKRMAQIQPFIEKANLSTTSRGPQKDPTMCLGISTVARPYEQYVQNTVGSLLEGLDPFQRSQIHLIVFIAQTEPQLHPMYNDPWLKNLANQILKYDISDQERKRLQAMEEEHQFWNKSAYDYAYLLEKCFATGAAWLAIVEDDTIAVEGWYPQAITALNQIKKQRKDDKWVYLRIFYTEKLFGWNSEEWLKYLSYSLLFFALFCAVPFGSFATSRHVRKYVSIRNIQILCYICFPASVVLYFMAGKLSMQPPPQGLHKMQRFGCCAQGLIFPRDMAPRAISAIKDATDMRYYVDMTLERWADVQHMAKYALVPPLLQHVGSRSSKGLNFDEGAVSIWNFAFEDYR